MIYTLQNGGVEGGGLLLIHLILDLLLDSRSCSSIGWPVLGTVGYDFQQLKAVVTPEGIRNPVIMITGLTSVIQRRDVTCLI